MPRTITLYGDDEQFTPDQLTAAELLAQPGRSGLTMAQVAAAADTSERSLQRWRRDRHFSEFVKRRTMENATEYLSTVMGALVEKASTGSSIKAIEIYLRSVGALNNEMIVKPMQPDDSRSNEAIEQSIRELEQQLRELEDK